MVDWGDFRRQVDRVIRTRYPWMSREDHEDLAQDLCERCVRYKVMESWERYGVKLSMWITRQVKHQMYFKLRSAETVMRASHAETLPLSSIALVVSAKTEDVVLRLDVKALLESYVDLSAYRDCGGRGAVGLVLAMLFTGSTKMEASKAVGITDRTVRKWCERVGEELQGGGY